MSDMRLTDEMYPTGDTQVTSRKAGASSRKI